MLNWTIDDTGVIQIGDDADLNPDNSILVPFSPISAALVSWAKEQGLEIITANPLVTAALLGVRHEAMSGFRLTAYVESVRFHTSDGSTATAVFDDAGRPDVSLETATALHVGDSGNVERIVLSVRVSEQNVPEYTAELETNFLVWQAANWSLRVAIARSTADLDAVSAAIRELCAQVMLCGGDSDADYGEILGFEASRELELAYVCKNIEWRAHNLRKGKIKATYPNTVKAMMELLSLTNDDIEAYLKTQGLSVDHYDPKAPLTPSYATVPPSWTVENSP